MRHIGIHGTTSGVNVIVRRADVLEFALVFSSMEETRTFVEKFSSTDIVCIAQTIPHYLSTGATEEDFISERDLLFPKSSGSKVIEKIFPVNGGQLCGVYDVKRTVFGSHGESRSHVVALAALVANDNTPCTMVHVEDSSVEVFDVSASGAIESYVSSQWGDASDISALIDGRPEAVFSGNALRRDVLEDVRKLSGTRSSRLNAFGLMKSALPTREREYCSRTSHLFGAAVGVTLLK